MKTFLWRSLLIVSTGLLGAYLGFWAGAAFFVPRNSGLAGGAMVLMYGILGFAGFAIAGAVAAFRLQQKNLARAALIIGCPVLLFYLALTVIALMKAAAEREPDTAFEPAGTFSVTMERINSSDPYLFVKMHVDSKARTWEQTGPAPENKVCSAGIKANNLIDVRRALDALRALNTQDLADCTRADHGATKRLHWDVAEGQIPTGSAGLPARGKLDVNPACLRQHPEIARTLSLVERIPHHDGGKVSCK